MNINHPPVNFHSENGCASEIFLEGTPHSIQPEIPIGFEPSLYPIISRHVLGLEPPSFGAACATIVADPQYRRHVDHLHGQGPRPVGEFLAELAVEHGLQSEINAKLLRYSEISDAALNEIGGREFPPLPMYVVSK